MITRFHNIADLLLPNLRRALNQAEWTSPANARLAYLYIDTAVMDELRRIATLSKEAAESEAEQYERRD